MTTHDKHIILQACAFAREFIKEADRASGGLSSQIHEAAAQLRAALEALPAAIEGCACGCTEFNGVKVFQCGTGEMGTLYWSKNSDLDKMPEMIPARMENYHAFTGIPDEVMQHHRRAHPNCSLCRDVRQFTNPTNQGEHEDDHA